MSPTHPNVPAFSMDARILPRFDVPSLHLNLQGITKKAFRLHAAYVQNLFLNGSKGDYNCILLIKATPACFRDQNLQPMKALKI